MRVLRDIIGIEVLNSEIKVIGTVKDVNIDTATNSIQSLIVKEKSENKNGIFNKNKETDTIIPFEMINCIGDKIILKQTIDEALSIINELWKNNKKDDYMTDYKTKLMELLKKDNVIKFGDFTLSSGRKSDYYIDMKKAITEPAILECVAHLITEKIQDMNIDKIAGPALGAVPIATATSLISKKPMLMIRKTKKSYGTNKQIEGELLENDQVIIVEDVTTTGGSLFKSIDVIENNGGKIIEAFVIIDRQEGAQEAFEEKNIKFTPLLTINELKEYLK